MKSLLYDFRTGARSLLRQPGFTFVAVLALALGLGATTAAFSIFNGVLLRPLPLVPRDQELLYVTQVNRRDGTGELGFNLADYGKVNQRSTNLVGLVLADRRTFILTDAGKPPERLLGSWISADTFRVLGVKPFLGEDFAPDQEGPGRPEVVLLGYEVWKRRYGGLPGIIGRDIEISGRPAKVLGIMPPGWRFPAEADIWMPLQPEPGKEESQGVYSMAAFARMKPGVSREQAQEELTQLGIEMAREHPASHTGLEIVAQPLREYITGERRRLVVLALGAVLFVQLIACTNVASLLLARGVRRLKEIAVRLALGATRTQVIRQLLIESLLLGVVGGGLGFLVAAWGVNLLRLSPDVWLPFWLRFDLDGRVLAFAVAAALGSSLLAGLLPALMLTRPGLVEELKEGGRGNALGGRHQRLRQSLVIAQVALALVLLVGAGLTLRSLWKLRTEKLGFNPRNVFTFRVGLPSSHYTNGATVREFLSRLEQRLGELPGVRSVGAISALPGKTERSLTAFTLAGADSSPAQPRMIALDIMASSGALPSLGAQIVEGRNLRSADPNGKSIEAVVDQEFVRRYFPEGKVLGKTMRPLSDESGKWVPEITIVGVVAPVRYEFGKAEALPAVFVSMESFPVHFVSMMLRVDGAAAHYAEAVQRTVYAVNPPVPRPTPTNAPTGAIEPSVPIYDAHTLQEVLTYATWDRQILALGFAFYALLALFLSVLGIYGMMAYNVSQRTQEIGIRMALGAQRPEVVRLVVQTGGRLLVTGMGLGLLFAGLLTPLLGDILQAAAVSPWDPPVFGLVPLVLGLAGLLAAWIPARRATQIPPLVALRTE